jgi:hypothetical protein
MDIDPSHPVSVLGQLGHSRHLLGGGTAGPIAHGFDFLLLMALKAANCPAWIGGNLHRDLLASFYS